MQNSDYVPASHPAIASIQSCEMWLEVKRFADPDHACAAFLQLLDEIEDAPPPANVCIEILERLRVPMQASLTELERRYAGKALPLAAAENAAFARAKDLWLAQLRAWRRLIRAARHDEELRLQRTLLALRVMESCAGVLHAHLAARREPGIEEWRWLHQAYAQAESLGLSEIELPAGAAGETTSCLRLYAHALLAHLANPSALSLRDFQLARGWARRWAGKINLWRSAENGGGLAIDLSSGNAPTWLPAGTPGSNLRFIDCRGVGRSLRARQAKLSEGMAPGALGLGRGCPPHVARDLVAHLRRCWSDAPVSRQFPRREATGRIELVTGFAAIHQALTGTLFDSGERTWNYSQHKIEQLQVFQHVPEENVAAAPRLATEQWEALDESAMGFGLRRGVEGARLAHRQLIAVRPQGATQFILCEVRWLSQEGESTLNIGAKALPGLPQACAIRSRSDDPTRATAWSQAFILPLSKGLSPHLVLPLGWFQQDREIEMKLDDTLFHVRLDEVLERGHDYHRVRFTTLTSA